MYLLGHKPQNFCQFQFFFAFWTFFQFNWISFNWRFASLTNPNRRLSTNIHIFWPILFTSHTIAIEEIMFQECVFSVFFVSDLVKNTIVISDFFPFTNSACWPNDSCWTDVIPEKKCCNRGSKSVVFNSDYRWRWKLFTL